MTTTNLIRVAVGEESPLGTPATQMSAIRITGEGVTQRRTYSENAEIRADRQPSGDVLVDAEVPGPIDFLMSFDRTMDELRASALMSSWSLMPEKTNATADSSITGVVDSSDTYAVDAGGTSFKAGMLVQASNFTNTANNRLFKVASSTGTTVVAAGTPTLTDESAPPAGARLKVVGFEGASGDIVAATNGLTSTTFDFTTLGLVKGAWIKIGGSASAYRFATAADNALVRVSATPTAHLLALDNLPSSWAGDAGTGKTIRVWIADRLVNGTTKRAWTYEKGFLGQTVPAYLVLDGLLMNVMTITIRPGAQVSGSITVVGRQARASSTTPIDSDVVAPGTAEVMNGVTDVGVLAVGGVPLASPNYVQEFTLNIDNHLLQGKAVGTLGAAVVEPGRLSVGGSMTTYFGDATLWDAIVNNTKTSIMAQLSKDNQAYVIGIPAVRLRGDAPAATRANDFAMINSSYTAEYDSIWGFTVSIDRFEYIE